MIYSNLKYVQDCKNFPSLIAKALEYAQKEDLLSLKPGSYPIEGKDLFVNIAEYTTCPREERFWEAHKDYVDIHYLMQGEEYIDVELLHRVEIGEYKPQDDFLAIKAEPATCIAMRPGDFLICFPEEAHQTGVQITKPTPLKKAIFKINVKKL